MVNSNKKKDVHDFWDKSSCGEELFMSTYDKDNFLFQSKKRYELEPYIVDFADFKSTKNKNILEIGVGLGADHQKFIEAGANTTGIDLTGRAIKNTETRLGLFGLKSSLSVCDAENLKFDDISKVYVNQGPGHFSGLRGSLAIAKGVSLSKNLDLFGYNTFIWSCAKFFNKKDFIFSFIKFREKYYIA